LYFVYLVASDAALNPVSPEFVPRKMQSQSDEGGFDGDNDWQNGKLPNVFFVYCIILGKGKFR